MKRKGSDGSMRRHDERDPELEYMLSEIFPAAEKELDQEAADPFGKFLESSALESSGIDSAALQREMQPVHDHFRQHYAKLAASAATGTAQTLAKSIPADPRVTDRRRSGNIIDEFDAAGLLIRSITHFSTGAVVAEYNSDGVVAKTYAVDK
jgi:hypothetical protein